MPDAIQTGGIKGAPSVQTGGVKPPPPPRDAGVRVVPYVPTNPVPQPTPRENIRVGFNEFTRYLGLQEDRFRGSELGQVVVDKINSNAEHAPVKGPFFAFLSTILGVGISKGSVPNPIKRFALNTPIGSLFDVLVDPDKLNTTGNDFLDFTSPGATGIVKTDGSQFPKLWFSDP